MAGVSVGVALFGLSNGGNFALVALEMSASGASDTLVGLATSAYFVGTLAASLTCGVLVRRIGHKWAFAGAALLGCLSTAALVFVEQTTLWPIIRAVTGYSIGTYYVVVESWFNHATQNRTRGRVLASYETIRLTAVAGGSFLLISLYEALGLSVFLVAALMYVSAILPVSLNRLSSPAPSPALRFPLVWLLRRAPLGLACCFVGGLTTAAIYGLAPLYGRYMGLGTLALSAFVFISHFGAFFVQYPTGLLSDRLGRNLTILLLCLIGAVAAGLLGIWERPVLPVVLIAGAVCHTVFTLGAVYTNDHLDPAAYTVGAAVLLVGYDIGTVVGPMIASLTMEALGARGLYLFIGAVLVALAVVAGHRVLRDERGVPTRSAKRRCYT
jgi:MFS family permease